MEETIYKVIQKIRLEKNFTQEYMAEQLSISQTHYSKIERGMIHITLDRFLFISKILSTHPRDFFNKL